MFTTALSISGAFVAGALGAFVFLQDRRGLTNQLFAVGMIALAAEGIFSFISMQGALLSEVLYWQRLKLAASTFLPGTWLLFSLTFARANYRDFLGPWKWIAISAFLFPLGLVMFFGHALFSPEIVRDGSPIWVLPLGWSGRTLFLFSLLTFVAILINLEKTLRGSTGSIRWRIKFVILGLGGLFAVRVYTDSQTLLFSSVDMALELLDSASLLVAGLLMIFSFGRVQLGKVDIYLSPSFLHNSITALVVGFYLLVVGVSAEAVRHFGGNHALTLTAFLLFVGFLCLTVFLLSDQLREQIRRFIYRNLLRPKYDYRKEWITFNQRMAAHTDIKHLCSDLVRAVSQTFGVPGVNVWLFDETQECLVLGGSTVLTEAEAVKLEGAKKAAASVIPALRNHEIPFDLNDPADWALTVKAADPSSFHQAEIRYCVPLISGSQMLGVLTLNDRLVEDTFSIEDFDLLKTVADQAAISIVNLKQSADLLRAKELETFQMLSAFFLHDLKNMASMLSLTVQNIKTCSDGSEFRRDALETISRSVEKINAMCAQLSLLSKELDLKVTEVDLNELISTTLVSLNGSFATSLFENLQPLPRVVIDADQVQKMLINLVLNAREAAGDGGHIQVASAYRNGQVFVSVSDNGCGMSKDFIAHSLFRLFRTTKNAGVGIGLFQCRRIVEAHGGRIQVESEEGKGTTFTVILPVSRQLRDSIPAAQV